MARYEDPQGGLGRLSLSLFLAAAGGFGLFALGRFGSRALCDGACAALGPFSDMVSHPFLIAGDVVCWLMVLIGVTGLVLWRGFAAVPAQAGLALVGGAAMVLWGALWPQPATVPVEVPAAPAVAPKVEPIVPVKSEAPLVPECPPGNFWNGEGCLSCTIAQSVPAPAKIFFSPLAFEAAWKYADDRKLVGGQRTFYVDDLAAGGGVSAGGLAVCASTAVLVVGSASSDGPKARNLARAARRATRLADHVAQACPGDPAIFAISVGQSGAAVDTALDRAVTVMGLDTADGAPIDAALLAEELGYAVYSDTHGAALLSRHTHFNAADWQWVRGGPPTPAPGPMVAPAPRPYEMVDRLRDDAPETCLGDNT